MAQEVESYSNLAFQKGWQGRARGLWACAALGLAFGAAIGVIAPFFPVLVGAQTLAGAASLILPSMAVMGAAGIAAGFAAGQSVGVTAGSVSGVAKEQEERGLAQSGGTALERTGPTPNELAVKPLEGISDYIKPKPMAFFATLGAIGGAVMGAAALVLGSGGSAIPGASLLLGNAVSNPAAVIALSTGVTASFGALFGTNMPRFTTITQNFMGTALSGELFEAKESSNAPQLAKQPEPALIPAVYSQPAEPVQAATLAPKKHESFQAMLAAREAQPASHSLI